MVRRVKDYVLIEVPHAVPFSFLSCYTTLYLEFGSGMFIVVLCVNKELS